MLAKVLAFGLLLAALPWPSSAAPIEIVVSRDPEPVGSLFGWSLRVGVESGLTVGLIQLISHGADAFEFNTAYPALDLAFSQFAPLTQGAFFSALVLSAFPGDTLIAGPAKDVFLGRFLSSFASTSDFLVLDGEDELNGTVFDAGGAPYSRADFSLAVIPEPSELSLECLGLIELLALAQAGARVHARSASSRLAASRPRVGTACE